MSTLPEGAPKSAHNWLYTVYGNGAPGFLMLWEKATRKSVAFNASTLDAAADNAVSIAKVGEVYYGLGLQKEAPTGQRRGSGDTTCALGGFWFDFDIAGEGHAQTNLPKSLDDVTGLLAELPVPATALIHSGGGVHAYWLGTTLWRYDTAADRKHIQNLSHNWQRMVIAKATDRGWKLDTTSDLARVLRLPGTFNRKTNTPRPVEVIDWAGCRYDIAEFEKHCGIPTSTASKPSSQKQQKKREPQPQAHLLLQCPWVKHCVEDAASLPEPEWYPNAAKDVETTQYPYAELFRDFAAAACRPNAVVVTYGYGFGDDHVNRVLLDMLTALWWTPAGPRTNNSFRKPGGGKRS